MIQENRHAITEILSRQPLFRGLDEGEIASLAAGAREYRVRKLEMIFQKGDLAEGMHVVIMGQIKLALPSPQGGEKVVHLAGPGVTFGEAVVFLDKPYPVNAQATQESLVLMVSKAALLGALDGSPSFARKMLASLSMRLHELIDDMETCTLRTSIQRVVCYLSHMAPDNVASRYSIQLDTSKQTIASQLNLAPETFSRVLGQLSDAGVISVKGRTINVLDRTRMLAYPG
jgi:CRP/FNR family transcriptional regulator, dissimilatory nitrate respiration regulator